MVIYLDNASTTQIDPEILEAILPYFNSCFANPSSVHKLGRNSKVVLENCRVSISELLKVNPHEIFFNSGGTEGNNTVLKSFLSLGIKNIISSKIEHDSIYSTILAPDFLSKKIHFLDIEKNGNISLEHLEEILKNFKNSLVSISHVNSEIGNINDINRISEICKNYDALLHLDCVQSFGKIPIDFLSTEVDFATASAHKFHGPKGIGLIYINSKNKITPLLHGGHQEINMRAGTQNLPFIVGMTKALEKSIKNLSIDKKKILGLKKKFLQNLYDSNKKIKFNGLSENLEKSIHTILNISLPIEDEENLVVFKLDSENICVSSGSACSSGVNKISRVIYNLYPMEKRNSLRVSFSKYNQEEEINIATEKILNLL